MNSENTQLLSYPFKTKKYFLIPLYTLLFLVSIFVVNADTIFEDNFDDNTLNTSYWTKSGTACDETSERLQCNGGTTWGTNAFYGLQYNVSDYDNLTIEWQSPVNFSSTNQGMFGFGNNLGISFTHGHYLIYQSDVDSVQAYYNLGVGGDFHTNLTLSDIYTFRITVNDTGALYQYQGANQTTWTILYDTPYTANTLYPFMAHKRGFESIDNLIIYSNNAKDAQVTIALNEPVFNESFTFDVEDVVLNISTNVNSVCNYNYLGSNFSMSSSDNLTHTANFNMGVATNQTKEFNVTYDCFSAGINDSSMKFLTFSQQGVPLNLTIFVPMDQQEFDDDTNQIIFHIETNYMAECNYSVFNMTSPELFDNTGGNLHTTNYTTFYPNVSAYPTTFACGGVILNETVVSNLTFFLVGDQIVPGKYENFNNVVEGSFSVVSTTTNSIIDLKVNDILFVIIIISFITLLVGTCGLLGKYIANTIGVKHSCKNK